MKEIVLNGLIGKVDTDDELEQTIGIIPVNALTTFTGKPTTLDAKGYAFTKELAEECGWGNSYANVQYYICDKPINTPVVIKREWIEQVLGKIQTRYHHCYGSEWTGYMWTDEEFTVGGHSIPNVLDANIGLYIHMEITLYKKEEIPKGLVAKEREIKTFAKIKGSAQ